MGKLIERGGDYFLELEYTQLRYSDLVREWIIPDIRKQLKCGVYTVDKSDLLKVLTDAFKTIPTVYFIIDVPVGPHLIKGIDGLEATDTEGILHLRGGSGGLNSLYCHGQDGEIDDVDSWVLKRTADARFMYLSIPEIILAILKGGERIDTVCVCNPGAYTDELLVNILYPKDTLAGRIDVFKNGHLFQTMKSYKKLNIPKRFLEENVCGVV